MSRDPELADLIAAIQRIEPNARMVPVRALRRALRASRDRGQIQPHAIHDRVWRVDREQLFLLLTPGELDLSPSEPSTELLLLPAPVANVTRQDWVNAWRALFHAAVDREIDRATDSGRIKSGWIQALPSVRSPATWHSTRTVLREENLIDEFDDDSVAAREFAAFAMEVLHFAPDQWGAFFPGIDQESAQLRFIRTELNTDRIYENTRPNGLPPALEPDPAGRVERVGAAAAAVLAQSERSRIDRWTEQGNFLRGAVHLSRAGDPSASGCLHRLIDQLCEILRLEPNDVAQWRTALDPLLSPASIGGWPVERRLLYELQRACLAIQRPSYSADLVDWVVTLARRPIKRLLTLPRWLIAARQLRAAARYAGKLGENTPPPHDLIHMVERAVGIAERNARTELRPRIVAALDEVDLVAQSVAEKLSRDKLVEELLDVACARGFLRIGDLRDAIARNRVKLPDLSGPREFLNGDPLLRADRELSDRLDGVYRRGEIYMRALQRGCSLFFGTKLGRLFTKYVAMPFGGAFLLLEAVHHMFAAGEDLVHWLTGWTATIKAFGLVAGAAAQSVAENPSLEASDLGWQAVAILGVFLFLVLHWPAFRNRVVRAALFLTVRLPRAIRRSKLVNVLLSNRATRIFRRYLWLPLAAGGVSAIGLRIVADDSAAIGLVAGGTALLAATFFRTPVGREAEDRANEVAERIWRVISVNFVLGLLGYVLQFFSAVFEAIDRGIHAVDEWLRFREGESSAAFLRKVALGGLWSTFTYLFRFAWNLLVEPQINPIKHFPVVTVSHKMLLPLIPSLAKQFHSSPETMGLIVSGVPGVFGFLAWELKENWKLYRANASPTIRPAIVGAHGERVRALLRPGFHSGVVPKTFARLRRAIRAGKTRSAARQRHALHHIAEAVHRLAEREVVAYLQVSRRWSGKPIHAAHPVLTTNRILIPFAFDNGPPIVIAFEELGGWIIGCIDEWHGLDEMAPDQRAAFADAVLGLYKLAGVNFVREQTAKKLGVAAYSFDAVAEGIVVRFADHRERLIAPTDEACLLYLSACPLAWTDWVERWEADAAGKSPLEPMIAHWEILPDKSTSK